MKPCTPKSRCDDARNCATCAAKRQAKIADQAEKIEAAHGQLTLTVLVPEQQTAAAIRQLHASFMRRALAPAGIWTVETGEQFGGLHLNLLSPKPAPTKWRNCKTYSEHVQVTARDAAAYIAKRSGMPAPEQYAGRLYGAWGKVGDILAAHHEPVVQAAAIEARLSGVTGEGGIMVDEYPYRTVAEELEGWTEQFINGERIWYSKKNPQKYTRKPPRPELSAEERKEVMRKHLPNLFKAIGRAEN